jgi:hypothetical protein
MNAIARKRFYALKSSDVFAKIKTKTKKKPLSFKYVVEGLNSLQFSE